MWKSMQLSRQPLTALISSHAPLQLQCGSLDTEKSGRSLFSSEGVSSTVPIKRCEHSHIS